MLKSRVRQSQRRGKKRKWRLTGKERKEGGNKEGKKKVKCFW